METSVKPTYILYFLCFALAAVGCATTNYSVGRDFDSSAVASIERGTTTATELISMLGEPFTKSVISANEEKWIYTHISGKATAQNYIVTMRIESDGLQKTLDLLLKDGIVVNYTYNEVPVSSFTSSRQ